MIKDRGFEDSRILQDPVRDAVREAYGIGEVRQAYGSHGAANVTWILNTDDGRYALRRSNEYKVRESLTYETRLIAFLHERGFPAPEILRTRGGEAYFVHEQRFYMLTRFIAGRGFDPMRPQHLAAAGRAFGELHMVARELPPPHYRNPYYQRHNRVAGVAATDLQTRCQKVSAFARDVLPADEGREVKRHLEYIASQFSRSQGERKDALSRLTLLPTHGSYAGTSLIFQKDDVVGVLDFDRASHEPRGVDLAYALKAFARSSDEEYDYWVGLDSERAGVFLRAYAEAEPIPPADLESVPALWREQRAKKAVKKAGNFLRKAPALEGEHKEKKTRKLARILEQEATRLAWVENHGNDLMAAIR